MKEGSEVWTLSLDVLRCLDVLDDLDLDFLNKFRSLGLYLFRSNL